MNVDDNTDADLGGLLRQIREAVSGVSVDPQVRALSIACIAPSGAESVALAAALVDARAAHVDVRIDARLTFLDLVELKDTEPTPESLRQRWLAIKSRYRATRLAYAAALHDAMVAGLDVVGLMDDQLGGL